MPEWDFTPSLSHRSEGINHGLNPPSFMYSSPNDNRSSNITDRVYLVLNSIWMNMFSLFLTYIFIYCGGACAMVCMLEDNMEGSKDRFAPPTMWALGIELWSSGSGVGTFTYRAILPTLNRFNLWDSTCCACADIHNTCFCPLWAGACWFLIKTTAIVSSCMLPVSMRYPNEMSLWRRWLLVSLPSAALSLQGELYPPIILLSVSQCTRILPWLPTFIPLTTDEVTLGCL